MITFAITFVTAFVHIFILLQIVNKFLILKIINFKFDWRSNLPRIYTSHNIIIFFQQITSKSFSNVTDI